MAHDFPTDFVSNSLMHLPGFQSDKRQSYAFFLLGTLIGSMKVGGPVPPPFGDFMAWKTKKSHMV